MPIKAILLAMAALSLAACSENTGEVRYRVTVTVDDNGRLSTGNGVWSSRHTWPLIPLDHGNINEFHGDAIPVALPGKGVFFFIPSGPEWARGDEAMLVEHAFGNEFPVEIRLDRPELFRRIAKMTGQTRTSTCDYNIVSGNGVGGWKNHDISCMLMAFTSDPSSKAAFKSVPKGRVEDVIGKGVRVRPMRMTITEEPVTRRIFDILPWLKALPDFNQRRTGDDTRKYGVPDEATWMRR